jgi:hypothetical protein
VKPRTLAVSVEDAAMAASQGSLAHQRSNEHLLQQQGKRYEAASADGSVAIGVR